MHRLLCHNPLPKTTGMRVSECCRAGDQRGEPSKRARFCVISGLMLSELHKRMNHSFGENYQTLSHTTTDTCELICHICNMYVFRNRELKIMFSKAFLEKQSDNLTHSKEQLVKC